MLVGNGIVNDKGGMATWLLAAKAIKESGIKLMGDLLLMAVVGEIGVEPVDEFQPPEYIAKEAGTRYAITHGGVADFAVVAEGTDFGIVGVEAGKAFFKITVFGNDVPIYTPYIPRPVPNEKNPNAIVRISELIQKVESWAYNYEMRNRYECPVGIIVPKVNIGAIRGGVPWKITKSVQQCAIYVDIRTTPKQNPVDIREELRELVNGAGLSGEVELYLYRPAFEADEKRAAPLKDAITRSHRAVLGTSPGSAPIPTSSMWRDVNCFNEMRIPALTYGPGVSSGGGRYAMKIDNMILGTKIYAQVALDLCSQARVPSSALEHHK
jgi:acetylornithine deacetylase/succinyl-diaminopimelate desuccinylase-like protein